MAESLAGDPPKVIPRREAFGEIVRHFVRKSAPVLGTVAAVIALGEVKERVTGGTIETSSGRFTGVYENHLESKDRLALPSDTDILFKEWSQNLSEVFTFPVYSNFAAEHIPQNTLLEAAQRRIPLMFGDVKIGVDHAQGRLISAGTTLAAAAIGGESAHKLHEMHKADRETEGQEKTGVARRTIEKGVLAALAAWGLSDVARAGIILSMGVTNNDAVRKIESHWASLLNTAHPEDLLYFFRNAVMAEKLLQVAETQQQELGRKPHLAFSVGFGHEQIEDFLMAGRDVCRAVITKYPDFLLRGIVDDNGGIDPFSSSLIYQLPENLTEADIQSRNLGGHTTIIRDNELQAAISAKLN